MSARAPWVIMHPMTCITMIMLQPRGSHLADVGEVDDEEDVSQALVGGCIGGAHKRVHCSMPQTLQIVRHLSILHMLWADDNLAVHSPSLTAQAPPTDDWQAVY